MKTLLSVDTAEWGFGKCMCTGLPPTSGKAVFERLSKEFFGKEVQDFRNIWKTCTKYWLKTTEK